MNQTNHYNEPDQKFLNKIAFLDSRQREYIIPPETLIAQLPIQKEHTLLDVGAGSGFFTIPMAEITTSKVYALDSDSRMLSVIEKKAREKGLSNIVLIQDEVEHFTLKKNSVDFVMASLILHEVSSLSKTLWNISKVLKDGGQLFCLEYEKDEMIKEGPPMSIRIGSTALTEALSTIGFEIVSYTKINDALYTVLAVKKGDLNNGNK